MGKKLVIVESPAKAKTIAKIMGDDYLVRASMGHVRDLPEKRFGVDIKKGFKPQYAIVNGRKSVVDELIKAVKTADAVYLAPDPDREGEAIAWHLKTILAEKNTNVEFYRVFYNEVTHRAVREAFATPSELDMKRVYAQQARRIVDRIVGYRVSPLLWSRVKRGASAGRVQSVALRLVCEREREIQNFVPEAYWIIGARVRKLVDPQMPFEIKLVRVNGEKAEIKTGEEAEIIVRELSNQSLVVHSIASRTVQRRPPPPFITSTLQQAASTRLGMSPAGTMRLAQRLYEGVDLDGETVGLITYMRTDSVAISQDALAAARAYISRKYDKEYLPAHPNVYKSRAGAQQAHEAIRPTDPSREPQSIAKHVSPTELKVYRLIWERFIACQMTPALIQQRTVEVESVAAEKGRPYLFRATCSQVEFPGYTRIYETRIEDTDGKSDEHDHVVQLPPLSQGEKLDLLEWLNERKETQPPSRFHESSLVKELEQNGVGRPSTYAQILSTLVYRKYVSKEKRALVPTELGMNVFDFLMADLSDLFDVKFTAAMEEGLDKIEHGTIEWTSMVGDFYSQFVKWLEKAKGPPADRAQVDAVFGILSQVNEWAAPAKYGKRVYSDQKFFESVRTQVEEKDKPVSERQLLALVGLAYRYRDQVPGCENVLAGIGLSDLLAQAAAQVKKPSEITLLKLAALRGITYSDPVERNSRTYDDRLFVESLQTRVDSDRALTSPQARQLDRIVLKYSEQIPEFDALKQRLGFDNSSPQSDLETGVLLETLKHVGEWRPPSSRGKREFNDVEFWHSLQRQYAQKGALSPRQVAALRRLVCRYRSQIPDFDAVADQTGLLRKKDPVASGEESQESS